MKNMKKTVQKITLIPLLCMFLVTGVFVSFDHDVYGYYQKSKAVSKNYSFKRWNGSSDIRLISNGTVTVNHKVDMTQGSYQMCKNESLRFAYSDEFFFNASNGFWDTPNAAWCSHINDRCRSIYKGQKIYDASGINWWMSKWPQPGYSRSEWWDKGIRENRINEGWILWTGVRHTAPGQPYSYLVSSNPRVVSCNGMNCITVGDGSAVLTAYAKRAQARIWAYIEYQNPRNTWSWMSEERPYLNNQHRNEMWMSPGHTKVGSWTITVGAAARCNYCGDGAITAPEQCDTTWSGNTYPVDNCTAGYNQICTYCVSPSRGNEKCTIKQKPGPYCGDGIVQRFANEQCDNGARNGQVCVTRYGGTCQYCDNKCQLKTATGPYCGDGIRNGTEQCDGGPDCSADCTLLSYRCTGDNPPQGATWCPNDTTGLTANTPWRQVASCTNTRKCEYTMPTYRCTGDNPPQGATWCPNDTTGLTANTPWRQVASCTNTRKCEYTMPTYRCTGDNPPQGATWCPNDTTGLTANTPWRQVASCTNTRKCEYTMPQVLYNCVDKESICPSETSVICPGDAGGNSTEQDLQWRNVGKMTSCTNSRDCECYEKESTPVIIQDSEEERDGRMIEYRP
jgi:hypothetical protein